VKDDVDIYSDNAPLKTVGDGPTINSDNAFYLDDSAIADQEIGAIAKSEVYFKRPLDLSYFSRADGNEEFGNSFNPYWQARLVETTNADRMFSIALQQKQTFGIIDSIQDIVESMADLPSDFTDFFAGF